MVRGNVAVFLSIDDTPFITDGSTINAHLSIDVRKHDAAVGQLTATLTCEERLGTVQGSAVILSRKLEGIPSILPRGSHDFDFSLALGSQSLNKFPPSLHTDAKNNSVGVYWTLDVCGDPPAALYVSRTVQVFPAQAITVPEDDDASTGYSKYQRRIPMLASLVAGPPHKQRPKLLVTLFGPSYRIPKDGELCEVFVHLGLNTPKAGVFQSPNKAHLGVHVSSAADNAVVLSMCFVKLLSKTTIKGTNKTYLSTTDVWERELELVLPQGSVDLTDDVADLELPPCPGTTETSMIDRQYEIKFIFVLRALHFENLTRWVSLTAPVTVLPASLSLQDDFREAPPPYVG